MILKLREGISACNREVEYKLNAVIFHHGHSRNSGHYTGKLLLLVKKFSQNEKNFNIKKSTNP